MQEGLHLLTLCIFVSFSYYYFLYLLLLLTSVSLFLFFFMSVSAPQCSLLTLWCLLFCSFNITGFVFFEAVCHRKQSHMDG